MSPDSDLLWYFAYGSNMHPSIFLELRCMNPRAARPARLDGFVLCFNIPIGPGERAVANIEPLAGSHIHGVAYSLTIGDFERLDNSEGVGVGLYRRVPVDLRAGDGERFVAHTYQSSVIVPDRKPSARYLGLLLDGARHHGLPDEWLRHLETFPRALDEREEPKS